MIQRNDFITYFIFVLLSASIGNVQTANASEIQKIMRPLLDQLSAQSIQQDCSDFLNSGLPLKTQISANPSLGDIDRVLRLERALDAIEDRHAAVIAASIAIREFQTRHKEISETYQRLRSDMKTLERQVSQSQADTAKLRKFIPLVEELREKAKPLLQLLNRVDAAGLVQTLLQSEPTDRDSISRLITDLSDVTLGLRNVPGGTATVSRVTELQTLLRYLMFEALGDTSQLTSIMIDEARLKKLSLEDGFQNIQSHFAEISDRFNGQSANTVRRVYTGNSRRHPQQHELFLVKTWRGYHLELSKGESTYRPNTVLLDPDVIYDGLARGQFFESHKGEILGIVGFRPLDHKEAVVVVQHFDYDRKRIHLFELKTDVLHSFHRLNVTNISRPLLVGDLVVVNGAPNPKGRLQIPRKDFEGFAMFQHTNSAASKYEFFLGLAKPVIPSLVSGVALGAATGFPEAGITAIGLLGAGLGAMIWVQFPELTLRRGPDGFEVLRSVTPRSKNWMLAQDGLLRRPENFWISSQSLNIDERNALSISRYGAEGTKIYGSGEEWFISPSGKTIVTDN